MDQPNKRGTSAVERVAELLIQRCQMSQEAARSKASAAVTYEALLEQGEDCSDYLYERDWRDVSAILGDERFRQVCGTT